jgi:hypothetical protein
MRRRACAAAVALALLAVGVRPTSAQHAITAAALSGRVLDGTGAAVPGATVLARQQERNDSWNAVSDETGRFSFLYLPVGPYELTVTAPGFSRRTVPVALSIGQNVDLSIALDVGRVAASVAVEAAPERLDTRRTQAADTILPVEVDSLPLNGRNYLDLALLAPGVTRTVQRNTERFAETSAVPGTGISVAGQRNLANTFIVDGLSANDDAAGLAGTYFAEDVIREFQVVTSGGIAEFGRASSGIVNVVTKSGGNDVHARAYGYFRDDALDARNPLAARKDPLSQQQYGLTLSGPLVQDRSFLFGNVERTDSSRTGVITIDPAAVAAINGKQAAAGYAGEPVTTGEFTTGYDTTNAFVRADHALSASQRLTARYSLYDVSSPNARNVGGLNAVSRGTRLDDRDQTAAASLLSSMSSSTFNELRGQFTRSRLAAPPNDLTGPAVNISGVANFGTATFSPTARDLDLVELSDSLTLQRGPHLVKMGGALLYERLSIDFPGALQGVYTFSSLPAFLAGRYINFQQAFGEASQFQTNPNLAAYVQDEWRPRRDLTVNAGLRYDVQWLADPVRTDANNVSPRFGVAWSPGDGRTVVRGSAGLYFDRIPLRAVSNALQRGGTKYQTALVSFEQPGAPVFPAVLPEFPAEMLTNVTTIEPGIGSGVGRQAHVQVERQLGRSVSVSAGYLHLAGREIIMSRNVNVPTLSADDAEALGVPNLGRPDPRIANNSQYQSIGISAYDGFTAAISSNASRIGTIRASYTLSKALDDSGNAFFSSPQNNFDVLDDYGRSDNDQRHRLVVSGTTPRLLGFDIAYLFGYASAPPFNIQTGTDRNNDTNVNDRPAGVGRNTGKAFDAATLDLRVSRVLHLTGSQRVTMIVDAFNVLNRSNFLIPNNVFGPGALARPNFGQPTAASDPRQFQLGIRWDF